MQNISLLFCYKLIEDNHRLTGLVSARDNEVARLKDEAAIANQRMQTAETLLATKVEKMSSFHLNAFSKRVSEALF